MAIGLTLSIWSNNTIPKLYKDVLLVKPVTVNAGKKLTIAEDLMKSVITSNKK
jgi:hypothetical protein